jgi:hypothetical protein
LLGANQVGGASMERVVGAKQCDQHVDVEQRAHQ